MWLFAMVFIDVIILLAVYALWGRPWLKQQAFAQPFMAWIEPYEIFFFKKSETILVGRLLWVGSGFVTIYDTAAAFLPGLDMTPITTRIGDTLHIPQDMRALAGTAFIIAIGRAVTWLRDRTTQPIEITALPDKVVAENPKVAEAVAMADATKTEAVAVVTAAKAS